MPSSAKQIHSKHKNKNNYKKNQKKHKNGKLKPMKNDKKQIEAKCMKLFGSKKKSNKFIKQAILKGNKIRTKTKYLRYDYEGYQVLMENNDIKTNKKLGIKCLISIDFEGNKTAKRMTQKMDKKDNELSKSSKYPSLYPSQFQYNSNDKILILGEMDFSYALDIASKIGGNNIIASAYYNEQNVTLKTKENIKMFKKLNGKQALFGIDATNLRLDKSLKFDKILFGFPRNSYSPDSQKHNIIFMRNVFDEVSRYLNENGQFQLFLHINKSGHSPLEQWKLDYPKWQCIHEQIFTQNHMKQMFTLYQSHDGQNNKWLPYRTGLYVFQMDNK